MAYIGRTLAPSIAISDWSVAFFLGMCVRRQSVAIPMSGHSLQRAQKIA